MKAISRSREGVETAIPKLVARTTNLASHQIVNSTVVECLVPYSKREEEDYIFCKTKDGIFFLLFLSNEPGTGALRPGVFPTLLMIFTLISIQTICESFMFLGGTSSLIQRKVIRQD
jgi:hypothetical protein